MGSLLGKSKQNRIEKVKVTEQDLAILQLKQQRDKIKQLQKRINLQLDREREIARELVKNGQKERALLILRKKRRLENTLEKSELQLEQLEKMTSDIEFSRIQLEVAEGLKAGNESLKQLNQLLSIEDIETLLDETRESAQKQEEISALLSGSFTEHEENDLLDELELLVGREEDLKLPEVPLDDVKSNVSSDRKVKQKKELIEEMAT